MKWWQQQLQVPRLSEPVTAKKQMCKLLQKKLICRETQGVASNMMCYAMQ